MNDSTKLTTPFMTATWIEGNILSIQSKAVKSMDAKTYLIHYDQFIQFIDSKGPCKMFIDFSESVALPRNLRKPMKEHIRRHAKQIAVYSRNSLGLTIARLTLSLTRPSIPTKVFNDKEQALDWLKSIEKAKS